VRTFGAISLTFGIILGIYGRRRHKFTDDFAYNRYHYGVLVHLAGSVGLYHAIKLPLVSFRIVGPMMVLPTLLASLPAYYYGIKDINLIEYEISPSASYLRMIGTYCLIGGYALLWYRLRYPIKFIP
jgi:hypothetical protein